MTPVLAAADMADRTVALLAAAVIDPGWRRAAQALRP